MEDVAALVIHARDLHRQSRWADACDEFLLADHAVSLGVDDLELLAESAQILGRGDEAVHALERVYQARLEAGEGGTGTPDGGGASGR